MVTLCREGLGAIFEAWVKLFEAQSGAGSESIELIVQLFIDIFLGFIWYVSFLSHLFILLNSLQMGRKGLRSLSGKQTEGAAWQEATEISGPLITELPLNEVNLHSHPQVSLLSSRLKFSTYPGACVH